MKNLFLLFLLTILVVACNDTKKTYDRLSDNQRSFLTNPPENFKITFKDSNNVFHNLVIGKYSITESMYQMYKGGQFTYPEERYYSESGNVDYVNIDLNDSLKISLYASSPQTLHSNHLGGQSVHITFTKTKSVYYSIDFKNQLLLKSIGGKQFRNVVYAVNKEDTLFWSKDVGILGWTNSAKGNTVYRVF